MVYLEIQPHQVDAFQALINQSDWALVSQEGGQSQFIGWAYVMHWQLPSDGKPAEVWLHYADNQGRLESHLEMTPAAKPHIQAFLDQLNHEPDHA